MGMEKGICLLVCFVEVFDFQFRFSAARHPIVIQNGLASAKDHNY
jgi:hypothetical protein